MAEGGGQELVCSLYISPSSSDSPYKRIAITKHKLKQAVQSLKLSGPWQITETKCGLIAAFSSEDDAEKLLSIDLAAALGSPVQVARFFASDSRYRQAVLLRDVPWAIPVQDISGALNKLGIAVGSVERVRQHVRVEVLDASHYEQLLRQGLDFFGAARFTAMPERWWRGVSGNGMPWNSNRRYNNPILQCYRCQGFWHVAANCRHLPRCVRCGEPHSVEFCTRPRYDPVCCHCAGPHHAAYHQCPVRLQLLNATPISITLSSTHTGAPSEKQPWSGTQ